MSCCAKKPEFFELSIDFVKAVSAGVIYDKPKDTEEWISVNNNGDDRVVLSVKKKSGLSSKVILSPRSQEIFRFKYKYSIVLDEDTPEADLIVYKLTFK